MFNIGPTELIVILVLALIVFGPSRLPEIGRTVGKSLREVRRAGMDLRDQFETDLDDDSFARKGSAGEPKAEKEQRPEPPAPAPGD
ncbi:hypothetical protein BH20ACT24_BH20ACT24_00460 [soil metagenome]|nr:twin-arginine translocase TatA/TatE family subunit [Actinomycetota bacterium]